MKLTLKEEAQNVREYLQTIPAEQWVVNQQTLHFDTENVGKYHCYIGHVNVNPHSPYVTDQTMDNIKYTGTAGFVSSCGGRAISFKLNDEAERLLGMPLHRINNGESDKYNHPVIKDRVLAALDDLIELL